MSMYDNCEKDDLYREVETFLENHPISELLEIVTDAVEGKEQE